MKFLYALVALMSIFMVAAAAKKKPFKPTEIKGYYAVTNGTSNKFGGPAGANARVAYSGNVDVSEAITADIKNAGPGFKSGYLSIGGTLMKNATWNNKNLMNLTTDMPSIKKEGYSGIVFDIEEVNGKNSLMIPLFNKAFAAAKALNLTIVVTTDLNGPKLTLQEANVKTKTTKAEKDAAQ